VIFAPLPAGVLDFLLRTSILNRLHPSLCDAVTGKRNGEAMLAWIARHNLFLSALDADGFWFRYHPLMREALLYRLQHSAQVDIRVLHEQASNWFAGQQLWAEAIRHALAAGKTGPGMRKPACSRWRKRAISRRWCAGSAICRQIWTLPASSCKRTSPGRSRTVFVSRCPPAAGRH
jgi:hypothetical protein